MNNFRSTAARLNLNPDCEWPLMDHFASESGTTDAADFSRCRVCGSQNIRRAGIVEYYSGFAWPIYDCRDCQVRFTRHDETIYDAMHCESGSVYNVYRGLLNESTKAFKDRDVNALREILSRASKYEFIIDEVDRGLRNARLMEIGCSRGYLTSYFILSGYQVTGVDISESAVESAMEAFGDHFVLEDDPSIEEGAPYDVIYHVGTIGCVADPVGLTNRLLRLLKPGGRLLFNSPNLESCWLADQLWIDAAPPPDVVSMFPHGFWINHFTKEAQVEEQIENCHREKALEIGLSRLFGRRWKRPVPISLNQSSDRYVTGNLSNRINGPRRIIQHDAWQVFEKSVLKLGCKTGLSRLAPARPGRVWPLRKDDPKGTNASEYFMNPLLKKIAKGLARRTVGRLPQPASRLTGKLARDGGKPVRNTRFRPWPRYHDSSRLQWQSDINSSFRRVFTSGVEGVPHPLAKQFAQQWAEYCGCKYGLLLPHGTDALRIGLAAVLDHDGLDYGGEIIVPNFSFIASATAALDRRFGIAFVDVDPDTLLLDPKRVEEAIVPGRTRAIMPVHLFGQPADMTSLRTIAHKRGLKIVEDAAQAHGSAWETGPVGSLGDAAGFSFQSFKNLTCGEGGALTTNDEEVFDRAYSMHNAGRARIGGGRWEHLTLGWNCRPTEYQAALLLHRFRSFEREQAVRQKNFTRLRKLMEDIACLKPLAVHPGVRRHGMHMFVMRYRPEGCDGLSFEDFINAVQHEGAPVYRAYQASMSSQPAIQKLMERRPDYFRLLPTPVADKAADDTVYIPQDIFLGGEADMVDIAAAIRKVERFYAPDNARAAARLIKEPNVATKTQSHSATIS